MLSTKIAAKIKKGILKFQAPLMLFLYFSVLLPDSQISLIKHSKRRAKSLVATISRKTCSS